MEYIVLGTAGHIDHGKTSLVKALTGTDTDRLKEEKERGITIDLGFAYLSLPSGNVLSIVDVPGHERFVKNMVAGASGIDMVLLVIAADDGVMPQTRGHLDICSLLGIGHGLVALTKADMVDEEWLSLTVDDIKEFLKGSFLEGSPVIPVSSLTGKGVLELLESIDSIARKVKRDRREGIFRLPVDRSFTMKGFGTVVTGTLVSGRIRVDEEVEVLPGGIRARVRGIQVHGGKVGDVSAPSRAALNLQGVEREDVRRGDVVVSPGVLRPASISEAVVSILPSARPLKDGSEPLLHISTSSTPASVTLLESKEIRPGGKGFARIRLREPLVAMHGDRFVLRFSDMGTIGGGIVLDADPPRRGKEKAVEELRVLSSGDIKAKALLHIKREGLKGTTIEDLSIRLNEGPASIKDVLSSGEVINTGLGLIPKDALHNIKDSLVSELESYHKKEPMKAGMIKEEMRTRLKASQSIMNLAVGDLLREGRLSVDGDALRLSSHKTSGGERMEKVERVYQEAGLTPPSLSELLESLRIKEKEALDLLNLLSKEGKLVRVKDFFFAKGAIDDLRSRVVEFLKARNDMTPVDFKELTGLSRKFAIPLLEYLDSQKVTIRVGDVRKLRKG